jgi:hypothetical protein
METRRQPKEQLFQLWKPVLYSNNFPERKHNNLGRQQKLFVRHVVGEDCAYMAQEQQQAHKTNRDWHFDTSSSDNSNNSLNMEEASTTNCLTNNNTNDNNNDIITHADYDETEDYEVTDPDNFEAKKY